MKIRTYFHYCFVAAAMSLPAAFAQGGPAAMAAELETPYKMTMNAAGKMLVGEMSEGVDAGRITLGKRASGANAVLVSGG